MPKKYKKYLTSTNIILFILLFILFFLLRWNTFSAPFERDEGEYAYSAWILRQGVMPYENSFLQKPPMIVYTYAFGQVLDPTGIVSPRVLAALSVAMTTFLLALIAKKEIGKWAGWIVAFLFTIMALFPYNQALSANTEHFMLLPLIGLICLYVYKKYSDSYWVWIVAGVLGALTLLYKPVAILVLLFVYCVWLYEAYKKQKSVRLLVKHCFLIFLGGVLITFIAMLPFLISDRGASFWETAVVFNGYYARQWGYELGALWYQMGVHWKRYWLLFFVVIYFLIKRPKRWWYYATLFFLALFSIYQSWIGHYYIFIMPFWALIVAYSLVIFSEEGFIDKKNENLVKVISTVVLIVIMLWPIRGQFGKTPQEINLWIYGTMNPFYEAPLVAQKVKELSSEDDYVFVAGSEPEILFYAKRKSPTRYVITYPFILDTPLREHYQKDAINDLENDRPEIIVFSNLQHSGLWNDESPRFFIDYLNDLISNEYELKGGYVWGRYKGYWIEEMTNEDVAQSSLLLYKRISE